jgi:hypothetical protein
MGRRKNSIHQANINDIWRNWEKLARDEQDQVFKDMYKKLGSEIIIDKDLKSVQALHSLENNEYVSSQTVANYFKSQDA